MNLPRTYGYSRRMLHPSSSCRRTDVCPPVPSLTSARTSSRYKTDIRRWTTWEVLWSLTTNRRAARFYRIPAVKHTHRAVRIATHFFFFPLNRKNSTTVPTVLSLLLIHLIDILHVAYLIARLAHEVHHCLLDHPLHFYCSC